MECLPTTLLGLVFGCLRWETKLETLNLVCQQWNQTRAYWAHLDLEPSSTNRSPEQLRAIFANAEISRCVSVTIDNPKILRNIIRKLPCLSELTIKWFLSWLHFRCVVDLLKKHGPQIKVNLRLAEPTHETLEYLNFLCGAVNTLNLCNLSGNIRNLDLLVPIPTFGSTLTFLELFACAGIRCLKFVRGLFVLRILRILHCCEVSDDALHSLCGHPCLEDVHLLRCSKVTDRGTSYLGQLPSLRDVSLKQMGYDVTDQTIKNLPSSLHALSMSVSYKEPNLWDHFTNLEFLDMGGAVKDDDLKSLTVLKTLRALHLSVEPWFEGTYLAYLPLLELYIGYCYLLKLDYGHVGRILTLRKLGLPSTTTCNSDLEALCTLTQLTRLDLNHCNKITDAAFTVFAKFSALREINLNQTSVTPSVRAQFKDRYELL
jgi:hypothetical protein